MAEISIRRCHDCGNATRADDERCPRCGGETRTAGTEGEGVVYSWTTVHRSLGDSVDTPYTVLSVDLRAGVRVLGRLCAESADDRLAAGAPVVSCAHSREDRLEFALESS